ncbi:MAG TPA: MFS transporter [Candidatus Binatia bacterium]|nr:MFS transporter [Candidatus Binatia bacterium]
MILPRLHNCVAGIFYGWRMVGLVTIIRIVGGGLHQFGFTVFFLPISQDLGLSRAATSLAFSLSRAQGAIEAPLVGYLIDRHGPRPILVTAVFLAGVGYMLLSWVNNYAGFMIVYLGVISLAFIAGFVHSPMVVANSWFIRRRARAMTVVSSAVPIGGALISPLLAMGIASIGWRWVAFASGCVFLLVCLPLSLQLKRSPESMGMLPDGDQVSADRSTHSSVTAPTDVNSEFTSRQAMKTWAFWLLVLSMTARVTCYSAATVHFVPFMVWKGLSEGAAASLLGAFAFFNLVFHFILGWIGDRANKAKLLSLCHFLPALSLPPLLLNSGYWPLWFFTIVFALLDASFPIVWATVGDFFGRRNFATIRGMMSFFYSWGSVAGPVIAGVIYDQTQSYRMVLSIWLCLLIFATLLVLFLIRPWSIRMTAMNSISNPQREPS